MSGEMCVRCGRPVVKISIDDHTLRSCSYCELRQWESNGVPVHRDDMLANLGGSHLRVV